MKKSLSKYLFIVLSVAFSCGQKNHDHDGHDMASKPVEENGNQDLYNEVMKIHDEVMPKMNDIYTLKQDLTNKISEAPALAEEKKKEIEVTINKLDSASDEMMVWMRSFNPIPDSLGKEKAREYLETEMEKVKKVRDDITLAIEKAKSYR